MSTALSPEQVAKIAHLARLDLSAAELDLFSRQLTSILDYVEPLRAVDTSGVPATSHPLALAAPLRDDEVRPSIDRAAATAAAPDANAEAGLFKVPRVIGA
jgi:aspartyl-tRNA(Asn)/glutamyl-tRNA(Gln) amidotransferase subunit C